MICKSLRLYTSSRRIIIVINEAEIELDSESGWDGVVFSEKFLVIKLSLMMGMEGKTLIKTWYQLKIPILYFTLKLLKKRWWRRWYRYRYDSYIRTCPFHKESCGKHIEVLHSGKILVDYNDEKRVLFLKSDTDSKENANFKRSVR